MRGTGLVAILAVVLAAMGCAEMVDDESSPGEGERNDTAMALTVSINGDTDVAGFRYLISECGGDEILNEVKDLEDLVLPGMIPNFDKKPFDSGSRHHFSDLFITLKAGCYDVVAAPVNAQGGPSQDCAAVSEKNVIVEDKKTTEILLISQCDGPDSGALDVIGAMNHPPVIDSLEYQKFNRECDRVKICASASDPDNDPIRFSWKQIAGPKLSIPIHLIDGKSTGDNDGRRECVELLLGEPGEYTFKLSVYDLHWVNGALVPYQNSSTTQIFPVYAGTSSDTECKPKK